MTIQSRRRSPGFIRLVLSPLLNRMLIKRPLPERSVELYKTGKLEEKGPPRTCAKLMNRVSPSFAPVGPRRSRREPFSFLPPPQVNNGETALVYQVPEAPIDPNDPAG